jgi:hypothetical protein
MSNLRVNKYRAAMEVLERGRDLLVESLADSVLDQEENIVEGGFQFHEFLETQGARLHFLGLILGHLDQSAEMLEESRAERPAPSPQPAKPARPRAKRRPRARGPQFSKPRKESPPDSKEPLDEPPF